MKIQLIALIFLFTNCSTDSKKSVVQTSQAETFKDFYKKFYSDSTFQISRVTFPLKGFNSDEYDEELGDKNPPYFWQKKDWNFLSTLDKDTVVYDKKEWIEEYRREIKHNKDSTVIEKIYIVDSGFIEERKFKKNRNKWYLIFYSYNDI